MSQQSAKEKAEAYVREQLPELMELNAGCGIINKVTDGVRILTNSPGDEMFVREHYIIIGHPIQLSDWLRVLPSAREMNLLRDIETDTPVLDVWTENNGVQFNLTTGQPATEQDYQAFCEIVGI